MPYRSYRPTYRPRYRSSYGSGYRSSGRARPPTPPLIKTAIDLKPTASTQMLILPWEISTTKFNTSTFSEQKTNNTVKTQDLEKIIEKLKSCHYYSTSSNSECAIFLMGCTALLLFAAVMVFYIVFLIKGNVGLALGIFFGGLISIALIIIGTLGWVENRNKNSLKKREREMKKILEGVNQEWRPKGVNFNCGVFGAWISIELFGRAVPTAKNKEAAPVPASNTNKKLNAKEESVKKNEEISRPRAQTPKKPEISKGDIGDPFDVHVRNNPNNIEVFEPGNIGYAGVVDPNQNDGGIKAYNPPIIDVNVDR